MVLLHVEPLDLQVLVERPPLWWIGWAFSTVTAITFLAIGVRLASALWRSGTGANNPLSLATGFIFITCGGGHLIHSMQMLYPLMFSSVIGAAARIHYMDWHLWAVDGFTALAGVLYWTQRRRFPGLVQGAALYEDLQSRQQDALELNDTVVQELNAARLALRGGDHEAAKQSLATAKQRGET